MIDVITLLILIAICYTARSEVIQGVHKNDLRYFNKTGQNCTLDTSNNLTSVYNVRKQNVYSFRLKTPII